MFIFSKKSLTLQKNIKVSYLKAFFIQNAYDYLFLMSVNGKNDVIKGPVLPSVLRVANQICSDKIFGKTLFSEQTIAGFIK